jgi:hypothetical protein
MQQGGEGDCKRLYKDAAAKVMLVVNSWLKSPNKVCASSQNLRKFWFQTMLQNLKIECIIETVREAVFKTCLQKCKK